MAERTGRRTMEGVVVSDAMDKSVIVQVEHLVRHPRYKRVIRRNARWMAHDEANECRVGDRVRLAETRPLSKQKRWRIAAVVEKAK